MTVSRPTGCVAFAALAAALSVGSASGVVGGRSISIRSAPWSVFVQATYPGGGIYSCTGSIIDALHIVTAAHCLYSTSGALVQPSEVRVKAGVSNSLDPSPSDVLEDRQVSSFRIHPYFARTGRLSPDDVAVLELSSPLDLGGPDAQAVALPNVGAPYPVAASAMLAGFGDDRPRARESGPLVAMRATVPQQGHCGSPRARGLLPANGVTFCARSRVSALCDGDSGAGLVTTGSRPVLIGIATGNAKCKPGNQGLFQYVGAPEILRFIRGDNKPPPSPYWDFPGIVKCFWDKPLRVGVRIVCMNLRLTRASTITYSFLTDSGRILQKGTRSNYVVQAAAIGAEVYCLVTATSPGGTALQESVESETVKPRVD
jgi:hypothetical protein